MNGAAAGVGGGACVCGLGLGGVVHGEEGRARAGKVKWWEVIGG